MKKNIHIGNASIPIEQYAISGTAILGIRDSGKTYSAKGIVEQLLDANIPPIIFDPIGRWRYLKLAGDDSKRPKGYKIVVAGGEQPDLPLTVQSAPEIVRAAIRENIPLVLDFYDRRLSKADWRRIVQICFRTIMYENKGVRHLVVEEAAEFCPQKVMDGETYAEVERVVRMGGNVSVGITLINQRAQEVNKAVLDLCETILLLKQRGSHAIDSLERWVDKLSPEQAREVTLSLPSLGPGEGWLFTTDATKPYHVQTGPIRSFHPNRRKPELSARAAAARTADTDDFVSRLSGVLSTVIVEASANDPAALRRRVAELEKKLKTAPAPVVDAQAAERAYKRGRADAARACRRGFNDLLKSLHLSMDKAVGSTFDPAFERVDAICKTEGIFPAPPDIVVPDAPAIAPKGRSVSPPPPPRDIVLTEAGSLPKGEETVMRALMTLPGRVTPEALSVLTGYKRSTRNEYLKKLAAKGLIDKNAEGIEPTEEGRAAVPDAQVLPTGEELQKFWLEKLVQGERKLLERIVAVHPAPVRRENLDEAGYKRSSRNEYLKKLKSRQLITETGDGVRASDILFS